MRERDLQISVASKQELRDLRKRREVAAKELEELASEIRTALHPLFGKKPPPEWRKAWEVLNRSLGRHRAPTLLFSVTSYYRGPVEEEKGEGIQRLKWQGYRSGKSWWVHAKQSLPAVYDLAEIVEGRLQEEGIWGRLKAATILQIRPSSIQTMKNCEGVTVTA